MESIIYVSAVLYPSSWMPKEFFSFSEKNEVKESTPNGTVCCISTCNFGVHAVCTTLSVYHIVRSRSESGNSASPSLGVNSSSI